MTSSPIIKYIQPKRLTTTLNMCPESLERGYYCREANLVHKYDDKEDEIQNKDEKVIICFYEGWIIPIPKRSQSSLSHINILFILTLLHYYYFLKSHRAIYRLG